ncbi:MAG: AsmA-like C-terminal region-containing protein [Patescibacteria group bacterium]|nr:AsmA-like C-terminal region-containing protein [Patescibacteria group bacterium]
MIAKILKYSLITFSGLLILLILLIIVLRIMFPPEKLREIVISHLEQNQGRQFTFGPVDFSILHGFALDVGDFKISENPEFQRPYFFQADHFLLKVKLLPLLSRRIEIDRLSFIKPEIFIEKNARGILNTATLVSSDSTTVQSPQTTSADSSGQGALPFAMLLSSATISDGILHYIDRQNPLEVSLAPINTGMSISIDRKNASLNLNGEMDIRGINFTKPVEYASLSNQLALTTTYTAAVNLNTGNVSLKEFTFDIAGITGKCTGSIPDYRKTPMNFSLSYNGSITDIRKILSLLPSAQATLIQPLTFGGEINFQGKVAGDSEFKKPLTYQLVTDINDGNARVTGLPREIKKINVQASVSNEQATINRCEMLLGDDPVSISGTVALSKDYPVAVSLKTMLNISDIPRIAPSLAKWKTEGTLNSSLNVQGSGADFSSFILTGTITGHKMVFANPEYPNPFMLPEIVVESKNNVLQIQKTTLQAGQSTVTIEGAIKNYTSLLPLFNGPKKTQTQWNFRINSLSLNEKDFITPPPETTKSSKQTGAMESSAQLIPSSQGEGTIEIQKFTSLDGVEMKDVLFHVTMNDNALKIDKMQGKLFSGNVTGTGNITLKENGIPNYSFDIETDNLQTGQALIPMTSFGKYLDGLLTSTIHIEGSGMEYESIMKNLYSKGHLSIKEGQLKGLPLLASIARWSKITEWENLPFLDWHGEFYIQNQRLHTNNFTIKTSQGDWTIAGSAGFDYSLDYNVQVALNPSLTQKYKTILPGNLLSWLSDEQDRLLLNFKVAGTQSKPQLQWDTAALTQQVRKKMTQQVDEGAKKLLQRVLPRTQSDTAAAEKKQNLSSDTAKTKSLLPEEVTKKAVEQFKNIFKKKK